MAWSIDEASALLGQAWKSQRLAHAYLISGPSAHLIESFTLRLLKLVNGIEAPSLSAVRHSAVTLLQPLGRIRTIPVNDVRDFERKLQFAPDSALWRTGILFEADRLTEQAANAFLKTLEEPPAQTLLLLLSEEPSRLLPTVLSRCMRVELRSTAEDRRPLEPAARSLLDSLVARFLRYGPSTLAALGLARDFSAALDHAVEPARTQFEQQLAGEKASYKDTTDGSWVEERDEFYEHMLRSEHLRQRAQLVQILISFLGDALRCHWTSEAPDLPEYREATQALAARSAPPELLHRIEALQTMRDHLSTTAFEALVMETGFLRAFG